MKKNKIVISKIFNRFDWFGWLMTTCGMYLIIQYSGLLGNTTNWISLVAVFFIVIGYVLRVISGEKPETIVGFDTIVNTCYDLDVEGDRIFVSATTPEELDLYMMANHEGKEYKVESKFEVESFIKTEQNL